MSRFSLRRKKKIHIISNENAGKDMGKKNRRDNIIEVLEEAFPQSHQKADVTVYRTHSLNDLDKAKMDMRADPPDIIAVFGGDGTIQKLLGEEDGFADDMDKTHEPPAYIFYGGGSTDVIKGELNVLGRDSVAATRRIIDKINRGMELDIIHRPYLNINGKKGFIYASGLAANLLEKYNAKTPKGLQRLLKVGGWMLFNEIFRYLPPWRRTSVAEKIPVSHQFWSDEKMIFESVGDRSAVVASTLGQVGMGCKLTNRSIEEVAHFHCILSGLGFWGTVLNGLNMYAGWGMTGDVVDEIATKVVINYGKPVIHTIDGELYTSEEMTDKVVIEQGPVLRIIKS